MITTYRSMIEQPRDTDADAVNQQDVGIREKASLLLSTKVAMCFKASSYRRWAVFCCKRPVEGEDCGVYAI